MKEKISFVIPCYNSENTVSMVIDEIEQECAKAGYSKYEIIAVNDCSPDNVIDVLANRARNDEKVKVIDLSINGGKHSALMAGFKFAKGDFIVCVDDDMQCPMNRIADLIEPLTNGYDVSMALYAKKKESFIKRCGSRFNSLIIEKMLNKPKELVFSNFVARKKFVCQEMIKYTHAYPYLEGLTLRVTRNIKQVPMEERERISGSSGYTLKKSLHLLVNGLTAFSVKPLQIGSALGSIMSIGGVLLGIVQIIRKIINPNIMAGYTSLIAVNLFIGGAILLCLGLIGEYVGRIYLCINRMPQYVIKNTINMEDNI